MSNEVSSRLVVGHTVLLREDVSLAPHLLYQPFSKVVLFSRHEVSVLAKHPRIDFDFVISNVTRSDDFVLCPLVRGVVG